MIGMNVWDGIRADVSCVVAVGDGSGVYDEATVSVMAEVGVEVGEELSRSGFISGW